MGGTEFTARKASLVDPSDDNRHRVPSIRVNELKEGNEVPTDKPMRFVKTSVRNYSSSAREFLKRRTGMKLRGEHKD